MWRPPPSAMRVAGAPRSCLEDGARVAPSCGRGQAVGGGTRRNWKSGHEVPDDAAATDTSYGSAAPASASTAARGSASRSARRRRAPGIRFRRVDRPGSAAIPRRPCHASARPVPPALTAGRRRRILMIEHLMAALAVCQIDNVLVEMSGPELPAMDGSAQPFVRLMECAGTVSQCLPCGAARSAASSGGALDRRLRRTGAGRRAVVDPRRYQLGRATAFALTVTPEACRQESGCCPRR